MKKQILLTICLLISAVPLFAQGPTFTSSFNPYAGFSATLTQELENGVPDGTTGAAQVWNYNLTDTPGVSPQSISFIPPDNTTYVSDFPSATLAAGGSGTYTYYVTNSNYFSIIGQGNPEFIETLNPQEMEWQYPFSYGTVQASTYSSVYSYNGFTYTESGLDTFNADGYGTLNLNGSVYTNALRFVVTQNTHTIITGNTNATSDIDIKSIYYAIPGYQYPLLLIQHAQELLDGSYIATWRAVAYTSSAPSAIANINPLVENLNIFPNPSYSQSNLSLSLKESSKITIYLSNILGQKMKTITSNEQTEAGTHMYSIETDDMVKGLYLVTVEVNGSIAGVQKLEIQ